MQHKFPPTTTLGSEAIDQTYATAQLLPVIKYAGYLPFRNGISDCHRAMFRDLYMNSIKRLETREFIPRNLISTHPVRAPKFIELILEQTQKLEILEKLKLLNDKVDKDIKKSNTAEYARNLELIDKMVVSIFLSAEKNDIWKKVKAFRKGSTSIKYMKYLNSNHYENNFN